MSWWPDTSSRVSGLYFSTLSLSVTDAKPFDGKSDHGSVSSASTGRFAALLFPLVSAPKVIVVSLAGRSSISISSSKSDMVIGLVQVNRIGTPIEDGDFQNFS